MPGTGTEPPLPLFLQAFTWVDLRQGLTDEGLYRLQWGITGVKPGQIPASPQTRSAFTEKVSKEIDKLLSWPRLSELRKGLSRGQQAPGNPLEALIPLQPSFDVTNSIDVLHRATESWLEQLHGQGANTREALEDARTLLGWLVLLAVREEWLREQTDLRDRLLNAEYVAIPVETEVGTDVVVARLYECQAKPELDTQNSRVFNPRQIDWANWSRLEAGIVQQDRLTELRKLVWKTVMKYDPPADFGAGQSEELKETLAIRYKRGDHYYIIISVPSGGSSVADNSLFKQLRYEFPHLFAFLIGTGSGEEVLVMPERRLVVLVREFLLMLRKYS